MVVGIWIAIAALYLIFFYGAGKNNKRHGD